MIFGQNEQKITKHGVIWRSETMKDKLPLGGRPDNYIIEKLKEWIEKEKQEIISDERFNYPPAQVQINAPLALIQLNMESRMQCLKEIETQILEMEK